MHVVLQGVPTPNKKKNLMFRLNIHKYDICVMMGMLVLKTRANQIHRNCAHFTV